MSRCPPSTGQNHGDARILYPGLTVTNTQGQACCRQRAVGARAQWGGIYRGPWHPPWGHSVHREETGLFTACFSLVEPGGSLSTRTDPTHQLFPVWFLLLITCRHLEVLKRVGGAAWPPNGMLVGCRGSLTLTNPQPCPSCCPVHRHSEARVAQKLEIWLLLKI